MGLYCDEDDGCCNWGLEREVEFDKVEEEEEEEDERGKADDDDDDDDGINLEESRLVAL